MISKKWLLFIICFVMTGCARYTVNPAGDGYLVMGSGPVVKESKLIRVAQNHCKRQGQETETKALNISGGSLFNPGSGTLVFECLEKESNDS